MYSYSKKIVTLILTMALCLPILLFAMPIQAQTTCGALDVAFIVDDTGSMGNAISNVSSSIVTIIDEIDNASSGNYQLALVTFRDDVTVRNDLASGNRASVEANVMSLVANAGNDVPEASDEALNTVVNGLDAADRPGNQTGNFNGTFRSEATKIAILVTDAPPGGFDDEFVVGVDDVNANARALEALGRGIQISAVYIGISSSSSQPFVAGLPTEEIMMNYASVTGGVYILGGVDGSGTANAISTIIAECGGSPPPAVPEPLTIILVGSGAAALGAYARKRRNEAGVTG